MAKFDSGCLDHAGFTAIREKLTAALAAAIAEELKAMGDDAKGISWFSSDAQEYAGAQFAQAA